MGIHDLTDDGTIDTLLSGDGYSLVREKHEPRARYDIWDGETSRAVPFMIADGRDALRDYHGPALTKLFHDSQRAPELVPAYQRFHEAVTAALHG